MAGVKEKSGGPRLGAGRPPKPKKDELHKLIDSVWKPEDQKNFFAQLARRANLGNMEAGKLLMAYRFGKPTERREQADKGPVEHVVYTLDEWKKRAAARRDQAHTAMTPFDEADD